MHSPDHFKTILIQVVTSMDAQISHAQFEETLSVLLGPNALMDEYGTVAYFIDYNYKTIVSIKTNKKKKMDTY